MATKKPVYPQCPHDRFPMVRIAGELQCVAEFLDRCIGGKRVTDVLVRGSVGYYVFEDGHELPLLCVCCGKPLQVFDLDRSRGNIVGRRLEGMLITPAELEDGKVFDEFRLEFSKRGLFSKPRYDSFSPEVAAGLKHPPDCPHQPRLAASTKKLRKKQR